MKVMNADPTYFCLAALEEGGYANLGVIHYEDFPEIITEIPLLNYVKLWNYTVMCKTADPVYLLALRHDFKYGRERLSLKSVLGREAFEEVPPALEQSPGFDIDFEEESVTVHYPLRFDAAAIEDVQFRIFAGEISAKTSIGWSIMTLEDKTEKKMPKILQQILGSLKGHLYDEDEGEGEEEENEDEEEEGNNPFKI